MAPVMECAQGVRRKQRKQVQGYNNYARIKSFKDEKETFHKIKKLFLKGDPLGFLSPRSSGEAHPSTPTAAIPVKNRPHLDNVCPTRTGSIAGSLWVARGDCRGGNN